jgi:hypothetical protein
MSSLKLVEEAVFLGGRLRLSILYSKDLFFSCFRRTVRVKTQNIQLDPQACLLIGFYPRDTSAIIDPRTLRIKECSHHPHVRTVPLRRKSTPEAASQKGKILLDRRSVLSCEDGETLIFPKRRSLPPKPRSSQVQGVILIIIIIKQEKVIALFATQK